MTENEQVRICYDHLDKFHNIYGEEGQEDKPVPSGVKVTVFCKGTTEEGFAINETDREIGLNLLISKKWILHSDLEKIVGKRIC